MAGLFDEFSGDPYMDGPNYQSDVMIVGDANSPPVISDTPEANGTGGQPFNLKDFLGSLGTTARDVGTAVGTVQRAIKQAPAQYKAGQQAAVQNKPIMQWWQYATTQDKLMVGLAVLGIVVVLVKR
jgi:hypothetical protein